MGIQVSPSANSQFSTLAAESSVYTAEFSVKNIVGDSLIVPVNGYSSVTFTLWPFSGGAGGTFISQISVDGANWFNVSTIINGTGTTALGTFNTTPGQSFPAATFGSGTVPQIYSVNVSAAQYFRIVCTAAPSGATGNVVKLIAANSSSNGLMVLNGTLNPIPYNLTQLNSTAVSTTNITLQASQTSAFANGTSTRTTTTGLGVYKSLDILLNITAGGTATTGTLAIFLEDSADGGTTWDDLVSSTVFTFGAGATTQRFMLQGAIATTITQGTPAAIETLAAGTVRQGPWGDRIRVREVVATITGGSIGVTYTINAVGRVF